MDYNAKFADLNAQKMYVEAKTVLNNVIAGLVREHWITAPNGSEETRKEEIKATMDHISRKIILNSEGNIDLEPNMYTESEMETETNPDLIRCVDRKKENYITAVDKVVLRELSQNN